jgi:hypothetical protein
MRSLTVKCILFIWSVFSSLLAVGQVVNIEQARVNADSIGWSSNLDAAFFRQEFDDNLTTLNGRFSAQRKNSRSFFLVLVDAGYSYSNEDVFMNYKLIHVRSSVKLAPKVRLEGFIQGQDNPPLGITFRNLVGVGPRIRMISKENGRLYAGSTLMLENEWASNGVKAIGIVRSSNYLNFQWLKEGKYGISSTIYYQPQLSRVFDYRVSGQHSFVSSLTKHVNAKVEFTHYYDSRPPSVGLNRSRITTVGLNYQLDH